MTQDDFMRLVDSRYHSCWSWRQRRPWWKCYAVL